MTSLQDRSMKMNVCLSNRKELHSALGRFIDCAVLDPVLVKDICTKDIDESYVDCIRVLCTKLDFLSSITSSASNPNSYLKNDEEAAAARELEPELLQLKTKACGRMRKFLLSKLSLLRKPKTNIQIIQCNVLAKFSIFNVFFKEHFPEVFHELCNLYISSMLTFYSANIRHYVVELGKLKVELYTRVDLLLTDSPLNLKESLPLRGTPYCQAESSIFTCLGRERILNLIDEPLSFFALSQSSSKTLLEVTVRSVIRLLMNSVASEFAFIADFFVLRPEAACGLTSALFKDSIGYVLETLRGWIMNSFDIFGLLLVAAVVTKQKSECASAPWHLLFDGFFELLLQTVWPRFENLFESQLTSTTAFSASEFLNLAKSFGQRNLLLRFCDFIGSLVILSPFFPDSRMLMTRIFSMKEGYEGLLQRVSGSLGRQQSLILLVTGLDMLRNSLSSIPAFHEVKEFQESFGDLEKETNSVANSLTRHYISEFFGNLVEFVREYAKEEVELEFRRLSQDEGAPVNDIQHTKESNPQGKPEVNEKLIENVAFELTETWSKRLEAMRAELESVFSNCSALKLLIKKSFASFLANYNSFTKYVKANHSIVAASLVPVHIVMKEGKIILGEYSV